MIEERPGTSIAANEEQPGVSEDTRIICDLIRSERIHEHTGLPISDKIPIPKRKDRFGRPMRPYKVKFHWEE